MLVVDACPRELLMVRDLSITNVLVFEELGAMQIHLLHQRLDLSLNRRLCGQRIVLLMLLLYHEAMNVTCNFQYELIHLLNSVVLVRVNWLTP